MEENPEECRGQGTHDSWKVRKPTVNPCFQIINVILYNNTFWDMYSLSSVVLNATKLGYVKNTKKANIQLFADVF